MVLRWLLGGSLLFFMGWPSMAQTYVNYQPQYTPWQSAYILEKVTYTQLNTILHCQWRCDNTLVEGIFLPTPEAAYAWYLQDLDDSTRYPMRGVHNVQRNNALLIEHLEGEPLYLTTAGRTGQTIFRFEIHFPPFDGRVQRADLLAGEGKKYNEYHFNCFDLQLRSWQHPPDDLPIPEEPVVYRAEPTLALPNKNSTLSERDTLSEQPVATAAPPTYRPSGLPWQASAVPPCDQALVLEQLQFLDNQPQLQGMAQARRTLEGIVAHLKAHPRQTATLYGHTDVFGDPARNLELSKARAQTIKRLLVQYGLAAQRLECQWFGGQQPLYPEGHALNRRVEIYLHCPSERPMKSTSE